MGRMAADVRTWDTYGEANDFAWKNNFNKSESFKYFIEDLDDLIGVKTSEQETKTLVADAFYLVNQGGWKLFFSDVKQHYYWDDRAHLYCIWNDAESAEKAREVIQKTYPKMKVRIEKLSPKEKVQ